MTSRSVQDAEKPDGFGILNCVRMAQVGYLRCHIYSKVLGYLENVTAPTLETLDVQWRDDDNGEFEGYTDFGGIIKFFHGGAPKLREIAVRGLLCYVSPRRS